MSTPIAAASSLGAIQAIMIERLEDEGVDSKELEARLDAAALALYAQYTEPGAPMAQIPAGVAVDSDAMAAYFAQLAEEVGKEKPGNRESAILTGIRSAGKEVLQGIVNYGSVRSLFNPAQINEMVTYLCTHPFQGASPSGITLKGGVRAILTGRLPGLHSAHLADCRWLDREVDPGEAESLLADAARRAGGQAGRDMRWTGWDMGGHAGLHGSFSTVQALLQGGEAFRGFSLLPRVPAASRVAKLVHYWRDAIALFADVEALRCAKGAGSVQLDVLHSRFKQIYLPTGDAAQPYVLVSPLMPPAMVLALARARKGAVTLAIAAATAARDFASLPAAEARLTALRKKAEQEPLSESERAKQEKLEAAVAAGGDLPARMAQLEALRFGTPAASVRRYVGQKMQNISAQSTPLSGVAVLAAIPPRVNERGSRASQIHLFDQRGFFHTTFARSKAYRAAVARFKQGFAVRREMEAACHAVVNAWMASARELQAAIAGKDATDGTSCEISLGGGSDSAAAAKMWLVPELRAEADQFRFDWQNVLVTAALNQLIGDLSEQGISRDKTYTDMIQIATLLALQLEAWK